MASCGVGRLNHVKDALLGCADDGEGEGRPVGGDLAGFRVDDGEGEARPLGGDLAGFAWTMLRMSWDQARGVDVTRPLVRFRMAGLCSRAGSAQTTDTR